jgi:hypothetical protein
MATSVRITDPTGIISSAAMLGAEAGFIAPSP